MAKSAVPPPTTTQEATIRQSASSLAKSQIAKMHITTLTTIQTEMMVKAAVRTTFGEKKPFGFLAPGLRLGSSFIGGKDGGVLFIKGVIT